MKSEQDSKAGRRHHDRAFKQGLVRQGLEPGASVSAIALRSGINASMLFKWRRACSSPRRRAADGAVADRGGAGKRSHVDSDVDRVVRTPSCRSPTRA